MHDVRAIAHALGGDVLGGDRILCPGPGHSSADRSLSIRLVLGALMASSSTATPMIRSPSARITSASGWDSLLGAHDIVVTITGPTRRAFFMRRTYEPGTAALIRTVGHESRQPSRIKRLRWQTMTRGSFEPQRLFRRTG
jgi:hypothetical protein